MDQRNINDGRDQFVINQPRSVVIREVARSPRPRNLALLLKAVEQEVISRLDQSLHHAVLINLGKQPQPNQVTRPWDAEIKIGSKPSEAIAPETPILEVFERSDVAAKLLILGAPGSGKTTTLLDLAQALVNRANADSQALVPVLVNLSSWKDPKQPLHTWLVAELKSKYGVSEKLGTKWIEQKQLLPLLDGLDEVKPALQIACVQAINRWLDSDKRPPSVAVCSRREEYTLLATPLQLTGAIGLQDLTDPQIETYLANLNRADLWPLIAPDADLLDLVRKPLLLSITLLAVDELEVDRWHCAPTAEARMQLLFDAYIRRMVARTESRAYRKCQPPSARQSLAAGRAVAASLRDGVFD